MNILQAALYLRVARHCRRKPGIIQFEPVCKGTIHQSHQRVEDQQRFHTILAFIEGLLVLTSRSL